MSVHCANLWKFNTHTCTHVEGETGTLIIVSLSLSLYKIIQIINIDHLDLIDLQQRWLNRIASEQKRKAATRRVRERQRNLIANQNKNKSKHNTNVWVRVRVCRIRKHRGYAYVCWLLNSFGIGCSSIKKLSTIKNFKIEYSHWAAV